MSGESIHILLVEDSETHAELIRKALDPLPKTRITLARNLEEARASLAECLPDLAIIDLYLPDGNGMELLPPDPKDLAFPAVVMTGHGDEQMAVEAVKAGALDYIVKSAATLAEMPHIAERALREWEHISQRRRVEEALRHSHEFARTVLQSMRDSVAIIDARNFRITSANEAFLMETGLLEEEVIGKPCSQVIRCSLEPCEPLDPACLVGKTLETGQYVRQEGLQTGPDGENQHIEVTTSPIRDDSGRIVQVVRVARDITERKRAEEEVRKLAYYDALTELPNRALLRDRLNQALVQAQRNGRIIGLLFLDLDRFKAINDTLGHGMGDLLLQAVARRLTSCVRQSDTVARLGGDEFVILLTTDSNEREVTVVAQKILRAMSSPFPLNGQEVFSGTSIGIVLYPLDGQDASILLKHADMAMYAAKDRGRNNYQFYSEELNREAQERHELESGLRQALQLDELFLAYQPQLDLRNGKVIGIEALLRWRHSEKGLIPPDVFLPVAEEIGLIRAIWEWSLRGACAQNRAWQDAGYPSLVMGVNLPGCMFKQPDLVDTIDGVLEETGMDPQCLELEFTEGVLLENAETTIMTLIDLKIRGIRLTIDNYGSGYSSLSYLKNFPFARIKIAKSFVSDITTNPDDAAIVEAINAMANSLHLRVIAVGVETEEQSKFLQARHCHEMQGFYFARPMPPEGLTRLLDKARRQEES